MMITQYLENVSFSFPFPVHSFFWWPWSKLEKIWRQRVGVWLGKVTAYFADTGALRTVIQKSDLPVSTAYYIWSQQPMSELSWALLMMEGVILHGLLG